MARPLAYDPRHALNAVCPYFTMFPLEYPLRVLRAHRSDSPSVIDPFCGRGTTLYAARVMGLNAHGIDASPVAVAIAKAKLCLSMPEEAIALAQTYIKNEKPRTVPQSAFFRSAFRKNVLTDICSIRQGLLQAKRDTDAVVLLRAAMLGCLHGPTSKHIENQAYFSNQMPRTYAPKPDYALRFWKLRGFKAPKTDVLSVLRRKLSRIERSVPPEGACFSNVRVGDSRFESSLRESELDFSLVVTSPPYYGMRTYVEDQWLRNWFLGGEEHVSYGASEQISHAGHDAFAESLGRVWKNVARSRASTLHMYVRFGIIPSAKAQPKELVRSSLEASGVAWRVVSVRQAKSAASGKRQADHMAAASNAATEYDFHVIRD